MNKEFEKQEAILRKESSDKKDEHYKLLFDSLSKSDAEFDLKTDFNESVIERLKKRSAQYRKEKIIIGVCIFLLSLVALITFLIFGSSSVTVPVSNLYWYAIIFVVLISIFHQIEKRFLKQT